MLLKIYDNEIKITLL